MPSMPASEPDPPAPAGKPLLAVPNVSEGRDRRAIEAIGRVFTAGGGARLLDTHSDPDHHRSVYTLAGYPGRLSSALLAGARAAIERIDVGGGRDPADVGQHPHVGAVDVVPVVYLERSQRGAACAEALVVAADIGERLDVPVFLYGVLAGAARGHTPQGDGSALTRAELRRGGVGGLGERLRSGELRPDFGPPRLHPTAGATLVAAREPLVAFNLELAPPATVEHARRIASLIREGGAEGLPGVRAIGVSLRRGARAAQQLHVDGDMGDRPPIGRDAVAPPIAQVSMNVERPLEVPLRELVRAVAKHAEVTRGELVGLAPRAALEGFPAEVALLGFEPGVHTIENALGF
jgi:glutamate formiminotransferase